MRFRARAGVVALAFLAAAPWLAHQAPAPVATAESSAPSAARAALDSAFADLSAARFEAALTTLATVLADPALSDAERVEALDLCVRARVALGELQAAEEDLRQLLRLRPGFEPAPGSLSRKATERFRALQAEMVGRLRVELVPPAARLLVDGRAAELAADGGVALLVGPHELRAESPGFDPFVHSVTVAPGEDRPLRLALSPNARTVIVQTELEAVEVWVDGRLAGRTARPVGETAGPARLALEHLPLGEHEFELRRACHRTETRRDLLTADLLDRDPKVFDPISLAPASGFLELVGGPPGAAVRIDGEFVGRLPVAPLSLCPGRRDVEVRLEQRPLWLATVEIAEGGTASETVTPRPNVWLLGASAWPPAFGDVAPSYNVTPDPDGAVPASADALASWNAIALPPGTDLVLARRAASRDGLLDRWILYSPILELVTALPAAPEALSRPRWDAVRWGFAAVDSESRGGCVVVEVDEGGAAAAAGLAPGDRVNRAGGAAVDRARELDARLADAAPVGSIELGWITAAGEPRRAVLEGRRAPRLILEGADPARDAVVAAWARSDAAAGAKGSDAALAQLALLLEGHGRTALAADAWRSVHWPERVGLAAGTAAYYLGRVERRLGNERAAIQAFERAAASRATTVDEHGPPVAPAAREHLRDLGRSTVSAR